MPLVGTGTILDNDGGATLTVVNGISDAVVVEGGNLDFVVTLSDTNGATVSLTPQSGTAILGTDTTTPLQVSFNGGASWTSLVGTSVTVPNGVGSFMVRAPTVDDAIVETPETMTLGAATANNVAPLIGTGTRPQQDLLDLFKILGINYEINKTSMTLKSEGWKNINNPILVQRGVSSQFASGLLLNAWALTEDLTLDIKGEPMSEGYLQMTIDLVSQLGMNIEKKGSQLIVKKNSFITQSSYHAESDLSSLFAVAAFSVLNRDWEFKDFPLPSLQLM